MLSIIPIYRNQLVVVEGFAVFTPDMVLNAAN